MYYPPEVVVLGAEPPDRPVRDPLAVALANASFLGIGYLMLRRRGLAVLTALVTFVLLILLGVAFRTVWCEGVVVGWWVLMIAHGWFLAGGRLRRRTGGAGDGAAGAAAGGAARGAAGGGVSTGRRPGPLSGWRISGIRTQRLVALGVAVPVLVVVGLLRVDASHAEGTVTSARHSGDCAKAVSAQHSVWVGPRLADSPLTKRGEKTVTACRRLAVARSDLATGLSGDSKALGAGFDGLSSVLTDLPGHQPMVDSVLDGFLDGLPTKNACHTAAVTDWLRTRKPDGSTLDRASAVVRKTAPDALLGCGDSLMDGNDWAKAKTRYQQVLAQYPHDAKAANAKAGVRKAQLAIELDHVENLLDTSGDSAPQYCSTPARYSGAPARHKGTNKALFFGNSTYTDKLPGGWQATDASDATLVVCAGDDKDGPSVQTCPYKGGIYSAFPEDVTFHKIAIPVKVYELRTGRLVTHRTVEISGKSCPETLAYTEYDGIDTGPSSDQYVDPSKANIRAAFNSLVHR
ncbi:hypothetical protein AB0399_25205 [Streptomyces sp. NPDC088194]|uniref:hypothetical protein n=1 Tax=Streptomyces sp. NPDC088194 TaxID=3154931 RepID=UPI00344E1201